MLVLSRKTGEKIIINGNIEIEVTEIKGNEVKIGIKAPCDVGIFREEVYRAIQEQNRMAAIQKKVELPINIKKKNKKKI